MTDEERARAVFARLQQAVTDLVTAAETRIDERCPYRAATDVCTFTAGCRNQQRTRPDDVAPLRCGGDQMLRRSPA